MRIMQVIPAFGMGGGEIMCENLTTELARMGHEVLAVSLYSDETPITKRMRENGINVAFVGKKPGLDLSSVFKLRKLIRKFKPDVIHTHLYALKYAAAAKMFLGVKGVHTIHNVAEKEATRTDQKINRIFYKLKMTVPVALSGEIKETVLKLYKLKERNCPVVYNGIDLGKCFPKKDYAVSDRVKIIHVGRFSEQKNHACMIEALSKLPRNKYRIDFWGEGELLEEIRAYAEKLGVGGETFFNGTTGNIYPELAGADVFILPSKWEGMPMSIIEAMGTGLPIISSDVGGVRDMIADGESGILISPDSGELAEALERVAQSEELRRKLGTAALEASKKFSSECMARSYIEVYGG